MKMTNNYNNMESKKKTMKVAKQKQRNYMPEKAPKSREVP